MTSDQRDQRILQALKRAAIQALDLKPLDAAYFEKLRDTIRKARQFEGEEAAIVKAPRSASNGNNP
jgi:hypothetical protein